MITREEFNKAATYAKNNIGRVMPVMIDFKNFIQRSVLDMTTPEELIDIVVCRINQSLVDKLVGLAKSRWESGSANDLYCASLAVGTIIKEYEWGTQYLTLDGLFELATRIQNA